MAPVAFSFTTAPTQAGSSPGPDVGRHSSMIGSTASVPCNTVAPALPARSLTMPSRSCRVMT